ncbi:lactate utilization protein [Chloroflexota bacterium]
MVNETDMSPERKWLGDERAKITVKNLQRRNINTQYVASCKEALDAALELIPPGVIVARGDSISVDQVGIIPELIRRNQNSIIDPFKRGADGYLYEGLEERRQMQREAFFADVFLAGTNAVTLDGRLVNVDGLGNRVAAMIFGPKKVVLIAGVNKIVKDVDEAMERIHQVAAPINAKRHYLKHHLDELGDLPCVRTGRCVDCTHDWKICCFTVIIEGNQLRDKGRINMILVGEELGI